MRICICFPRLYGRTYVSHFGWSFLTIPAPVAEACTLCGYLGKHRGMDVNSGVLVCDNGSGSLKAGFAGDICPRVKCKCVVGRQSTYNIMVARPELPGVLIGDGCLKHRQHVSCSRPISKGVIQQWQDMEVLWDYVFREKLGVNPDDKRILLTEPALNPAQNRARLLEHMFEKLGFAAVTLHSQAVLSLYSQGLMTGLVVDSGASSTHIVPVTDGFVDMATVKRLDVAGDHITERLCNLLECRGYCVPAAHDPSMEVLKERCCYVAIEYEREKALALETTCLMTQYTLPDGQTIRLGEERFKAPEVLFRPALLGLEIQGLAEAVHSCIHSLPIDSRLRMYNSILLAGGTSMLPGLSTRLERELSTLYLERVLKGRLEGLTKLKLRVEDPPMRNHMVFTGASIFAQIVADYNESWVTKADYDEDPKAALQKCCQLVQGSL